MSPVVTEDRVKIIVGSELQNYERVYGEPRHRENTGKFDVLFEVMNQVKGSLFAFKIMMGFLAFLCMATLALLSYLATHHDGKSAIASTPATVARGTSDAGTDMR